MQDGERLPIAQNPFPSSLAERQLSSGAALNAGQKIIGDGARGLRANTADAASSYSFLICDCEIT